MGNEHSSIVPYGVYRVKDQHIMIAGATNAQFKSMCEVIARPDLPSLYNNNSVRVKHRAKIREELEREFAKWEINELCIAFNNVKVPASKI